MNRAVADDKSHGKSSWLLPLSMDRMVVEDTKLWQKLLDLYGFINSTMAVHLKQ